MSIETITSSLEQYGCKVSRPGKDFNPGRLPWPTSAIENMLQMVLDMFTKHPILRTSDCPLSKVQFSSNMDEQAFQETFGMPRIMLEALAGGDTIGAATNLVKSHPIHSSFTVNDAMYDLSQGFNSSGDPHWSTVHSILDLAAHELTHALMYAAYGKLLLSMASKGGSPYQIMERLCDALLRSCGLTTHSLKSISTYGASEPAEGVADLGAMITTPHKEVSTYPELASKAHKLIALMDAATVPQGFYA